ncbi:hypothetical protein SPRG_17727 [Saprolegnia parasitica CBS 223.65]|uniref:Uncharacterized protein n=1 Tax=Saprolegnia parasitica (strain CBS 223.65) TaxID=695850 RepID=A0A067BEI9_SAPPC|nr:hypothetical protein SPRG_17727 [Saprolegnia parasitica CBS 223.65]KDO16784.1 hypothetical protein SPRG_17727 [Saprolegnia parasitica CBS 223.65]|eukprot:XP_012212507.1 hypothetical protein SPRG_17727 [Saprolegnia parasitica CBS 223.65]
MAKNVVGLVILFVGFWGNANLQTLTTYLHQTPSFNLGYYVYCGPAQLASIVGIMTATLIQMWFNPRLVTQTWLLLVFSLVNWFLVFALEAFVFPRMSSSVPGPCGLATSTGCLQYTAIKRNFYLSAVASSGVVLVAIGCVYLISLKQRKTGHVVPSAHSVLTYLRVPDLRSTVTSLEGCLQHNNAASDDVGIDAGILLTKNMLQVSDTVLTRTTNVQYELIYRLLPTTFLKRLYSSTVGSMLVVHIEKRALTHVSSYKYLHEMGIGGGDGLSGYFV